MRAFIAYEHCASRRVTSVRANLRTPMPRTYVDRGRLAFGGLAQYFEHDVPGIFASVKDRAVCNRIFATPTRTQLRALKSLDAWFESQARAANEDFALGEPIIFQRMLHDDRARRSAARSD